MFQLYGTFENNKNPEMGMTFCHMTGHVTHCPCFSGTAQQQLIPVINHNHDNQIASRFKDKVMTFGFALWISYHSY